MKALTIIQPWASLIASGIKRFETRSWPTRYRGPIAIHAGLSDRYYGTFGYQDILVAAGQMPEWAEYIARFADDPPHEIPFGAVIATAELVECWEIHSPNFRLWANEAIFGDYTPGRYAWELTNIKPLETPVKTRGYQGLWDWNEGGAA